MAEKKVYTIPEWFPRNPLLGGLEQDEELRRQWNKYLCIPKGNSARKLMLLDLKSQYGEALAAFYTQSQPKDKEDINEEDEKEPSSPPETKHKRPRPVTPPSTPVEDGEPPVKQVVQTAQAKTHYTPVQVALAEEIARICEKTAREHEATLLDVRKAWEYWQTGNLYFKKRGNL